MAGFNGGDGSAGQEFLDVPAPPAGSGVEEESGVWSDGDDGALHCPESSVSGDEMQLSVPTTREHQRQRQIVDSALVSALARCRQNNLWRCKASLH